MSNSKFIMEIADCLKEGLPEDLMILDIERNQQLMIKSVQMDDATATLVVEVYDFDDL